MDSNMREKDRRRDSAPPTPPDDPTESADANLNRVTQQGDALLCKANEAIKRALSHDSAAFLAASRQTGGQ